MQPSLDDAMNAVLGRLTPFVPANAVNLPANSVRIVAARGRNLALGNRRGSEYRVGAPVAALRGVRLDATARIEVWQDAPGAADDTMANVHANLLGAAVNLRAFGFIKFEASATEPAAHVAAANGWRSSGDFQLLYEHQTRDEDDAESFIVRIPVQSDLEEANSPGQSTETVIDDMRRWDNEAAPTLIVRGSHPRGTWLTGLSAFDFRPGAFVSSVVRIERIVAGAAGGQNAHANLADFLAAVTDPEAPDLNARVDFATLADFMDALPAAGDPIPLGDWNTDTVRDLFQPRALAFDRPIVLRSSRDIFSITYFAAALEAPAVIYLRVNTAR